MNEGREGWRWGREWGKAAFAFLFNPTFRLLFLFYCIKTHNASEANVSQLFHPLLFFCSKVR